MNVWQQNRVVVSSGSVLWGCLLDGFGPVCRHFSLEDQLSPPSSRTVCFPVRKSSPEAAGSKATAQTMWQNKTWTMQRPRKLSCKSPKTGVALFILTDPEGNTETMEAFKRVASFCVSTHIHTSHSCHQSPHYINVPGLQSCHSLLFWQLMEQMFLLIKFYFGGFNLQESLSQYVGSRRTRMNITWTWFKTSSRLWTRSIKHDS